ncbi:MAG: PTS ascorbate transporter subunit IIC [Pirellulales bacterium]|nr:PTS ascorbate transporter subunit IIC [Pirellulales bacterium]
MKSCKAFLLRMNPDLYKEIEAWAQQELRSVNGQIEFLLKEAVKKRRHLLKAEENADSPPVE